MHLNAWDRVRLDATWIINWQKSVEMKDQRTKFIELQKNKSSSFYSEHGYEHKKWKLFKMATLLLMVELV